jgi:hypothetical protein
MRVINVYFRKSDTYKLKSHGKSLIDELRLNLNFILLFKSADLRTLF